MYEILFQWVIENEMFEILHSKGSPPLLKYIAVLLQPTTRVFRVDNTSTGVEIDDVNSKEQTLRNVVFDFIEHCLLNHYHSI